MGDNMKNFANISLTTNSVTTGRRAMTVFQKTRQRMNKRVRGFLGSFAAVLLLAGFAASAFAGNYYVRNESELLTLLTNIQNGVAGYTDANNTIHFQDNVLIANDYDVNIPGGKTLTLDLGIYNFQGNGRINFNQVDPGGANRAVVNIIGSTMGFVDGMHLHLHTSAGGLLELNYFGRYTSSATDSVGEDATDNIIVNLTATGSAWDAFGHDVIIGDAGRGEFNITNGNKGDSNNVTLGNLATGNGTLNIWGAGTRWVNTENFVVGENGTGTLNLWDGALLRTGNFGVGAAAGGVGTANISGAGTVLDIFGSNTAPATGNVGQGTMNVWDRAQVFLRYNDNLDDGVTRTSPNLDLGRGTSLFDNAYFMVDRGTINGVNNAVTFQNFAMFEGSNYGFVRDGASGFNFDYSRFNPQGDGITLQSLTIESGAVFSPGYGSKALWERMYAVDFDSQDDLVMLYNLGKTANPFDEFGNPTVDRKGYPVPVGRYGGIEFAGNFNLAPGGIAIFDFDIEGDTNHPDAAAKTDMHKDFVNMVSGTATLNGIVHFRPMTGYYQDAVTIDFMSAAGGSPTLSLWPRRWFVEDSWQIGGGTLTMQREEQPFYTSGESYNERSVGTALDWIYNREHGLYADELMLGQQNTDWFPVLDWFWGMNDEDFRKGMRQLSGETRAASFFMPLRAPWRYAFERVNWRKRDNNVYFGQQNILAPYVAKQDVWVTPYYDYMYMGDDGNTSSAHTTRVSFMTGYDRALSKYAATGFIFGYSQPKLQQVYSRVIADDYLFGMHYNTRVANDFELKLWGSYGVQHYRLNRNVPILGGEEIYARYKGNSVTASIQVAKPYSCFKGVIRPLAALDYSFVKQNETEEDGYMPIALRYAASDWSQLFGRVGVRGDFGWKRVSLTSSLSYSYQVAGQVTPEATNQFIYGNPDADNPLFNIQGPHLSRTFVNVGLGSQVYLNRMKSRMFFVQYNGNYGKRTNAQNASIGYQMTF